MPKVEIEESELLALQQVNKFTSTALANPKTRRSILQIQKTLNPDAAIPELDATDHVMEQVKGVEGKLDAVLAKLEERDKTSDEARRTAELQDRVAKGQTYLRAQGYQDDGIKKIEELMLAENIASYAAGAALFEKLNPPSDPIDSSRATPFGSMSGNDMSDDGMKELMDSQGLSDKWLQTAINGAKREFRGH